MIPFEAQEKCECNSVAAWRCECSSILLCEGHLIEHLNIFTDHTIKKVQSKLNFSLVWKNKLFIRRKIESIGAFSKEILENAAHIISEITLMTNKAMDNLENFRKYYLQLLEWNEQGTEYEEYLKFMNKDIPYEPYYDKHQLVELAGIATNQYISTENCSELRFSQEGKYQKKICGKCLEIKEIEYFGSVECKDINMCAICITCRIKDPIQCIRCYRYYSNNERTMMGILEQSLIS